MCIKGSCNELIHTHDGTSIDRGRNVPDCLPVSSDRQNIFYLSPPTSNLNKIIANEPAKSEAAENSAARRIVYAKKILDQPLKV